MSPTTVLVLGGLAEFVLRLTVVVVLAALAALTVLPLAFILVSGDVDADDVRRFCSPILWKKIG